MKKALIFWGGWMGHQPDLVAARFAAMLEEEGFEVRVEDNQECLNDPEYLKSLDLIVPCWTMGTIEKQASKNISAAVASGVGLAGCHGGMCDSFRNSTEWQFITGGQWVCHPGADGVSYTVNVRRGSSPIVEGIDDFTVVSEHYYLHVDPSVEVLATTRFPVVNFRHSANKPVDMPVVWTKFWGLGRVFYCSLGHHDDVFDNSPTAQVLMERGMLWAADGKAYADENNLDPTIYDNSAKMF
jgi:type 1 glutamine amidotransferase